MLSLLGAAQGIRDQITSRGEAAVGFPIPDIVAQIPMIVEMFARMIAADPERRNLLIPNAPFESTVADGKADLTPNLTDDRLLLDYWADWEVTLADGDEPFHLLSNRAQLRNKRPLETMFIHAAVEGQTLHVRDIDGALDADLGDIRISGPFIPVIAEDAADTTLPSSLEGMFLRFGAQTLAPSTNAKK